MKVALTTWHSPARPSARGYEIACAPVAVADVAAVLQRLEPGAVADGAFLLLPLRTTDAGGFAAAVASTRAAAIRPRIGVVLDRETFERLEPGDIAGCDAGIVLDRVNATTPLSTLIREGLEAVRFDSAFVADATRALRAGAALNALLALARDLGLATLGPGADAANGTAFGFDYELRSAVKSAARPAQRVSSVTI